ncbi:hypothetical protein PHISP_08230, partial [Aspergillus sp. HF37]
PTHADGATSHTHTHYSAPTSSPTPFVSAKEQASLLSVGMRIRKAVPEGYKTKPVVNKSSAGVYNCADANCAELAPFCLMVKPGGDRLEDPSSTGVGACITTDEGDAFSLPPSSQDSAVSSNSTTGLKRHCDSDLVSNESPGLRLDADAIVAARQILAPSLSRQRQVLAAAQGEVSSAVPPGGVMDVDDFEEAGFLQRREDVD